MAERSRILLIDDDEKLGELLKRYLLGFELVLHQEVLPTKGLQSIETEAPELVILDVMLPEMDGFETCRRIRQLDPDVPILMLTARGEVTDRVVGFELGADDYLPKPFEPRELVARIKAILKRATRSADESETPHHVYRLLDLEVFPKRYEVLRDGRAVELTSMEFDLFLLLIRESGNVVSRDRIFEEIAGGSADVQSRSVDVLVSRLRSVLNDDPKRPQIIRTIRGKGYQLVADVAQGDG